MSNRRDFLRNTSLAAVAATGIPAIVEAADQPSFSSENGPVGSLTILFQGDSITDAGRDRGNYYANNADGMGKGYVHHIVTNLLGTSPQQNLRCYNRGISGHKVFQLADRWEDDCIQLRPDVLSILIGVNDYWHTLSSGYTGTVQTYETDYRKLMERTKKELPATRLIICEPFAVAGGTAINEKWEDFKGYRAVAKAVANDFGAAFVPFQSVFDEALKLAPASYWCPDGVHPSLAGAYLMKEAWLKVFASK
ncbi:MAG: lysophospholipase [Bacteroidetes bacterium]|nr:lysophospholipase [Bacteroidota bacterium]